MCEHSGERTWRDETNGTTKPNTQHVTNIPIRRMTLNGSLIRSIVVCKCVGIYVNGIGFSTLICLLHCAFDSCHLFSAHSALIVYVYVYFIQAFLLLFMLSSSSSSLTSFPSLFLFFSLAVCTLFCCYFFFFLSRLKFKPTFLFLHQPAAVATTTTKSHQYTRRFSNTRDGEVPNSQIKASGRSSFFCCMKMLPERRKKNCCCSQHDALM